MPDSLDDWFLREILAHEAALTHYITRAWPNSADVHELRHDIYIRILEAASKSRPTSPKSFLFTTARHLMADRARRARIVSIDLLEDLDSLNVLVDELSPERRIGARQQLAQLSAAFDALPDRCRDVVWMRKVEDLPQKEIAARLGIAEATVEKHLVRGMHLLADRLAAADAGIGEEEKARPASEEPRHGK